MLRYIQHDSHASTQSALDRFVGLTNQDSVFHMDSSSLSLSYYTQERNDKMTEKQDQKEIHVLDNSFWIKLIIAWHFHLLL